MAIIYTDGGSRGNPGPAAAGYWITEYGKIIGWKGIYLGHQTNNEAEYEAVKAGLLAAETLGCKIVEVRSDSKLVIEQLKENWKVGPELKPHFLAALELEKLFQDVLYTHIPREQNAVADFICNITLNEQEKR